MARFLHLKHSPPLAPASATDSDLENFSDDDETQFEMGASAAPSTRRELFKTANFNAHPPSAADLTANAKWYKLMGRCEEEASNAAAKTFVNELKAFRMASQAAAEPTLADMVEQACPEPLQELPGVHAQPKKKEQDTGPTILLGLDQSHGLRFDWHLAHEMLVNPDFTFQTEESNLGKHARTDQKRLLNIFVRAMKKQKEDAIRDALQAACSLTTTDDLETEAARAKMVGLIDDIKTATVMAAAGMRGETKSPSIPAVKETLDGELILQMVIHKSYTPKQLAELVRLVGRSVVEGSICVSICSKFIAWGEDKCAHLESLSTPQDAFDALPNVLLELLEQLKQARVDEMNVKMKLLLPMFKRQGPEYERELVSKSLEDGSLKINLTTSWLDGAKSHVATAGLSTDTSSVHLHALVSQIMNDDQPLPECLLLDEPRISSAQVQCRNLIFVMSFMTVITQYGKSQGLSFSPDEITDAKEALLNIMKTTKGAVQAANQACDFAQACACKKMKRDLGPRSPQLSKALRRSVKDAAGSVRRVFYKRVAEYMLECIPANPELPETIPDAKKLGLGLVEVELKSMAQKMRIMFVHNDAVFQPLFTSILRN